jgi:hypothetical protein
VLSGKHANQCKAFCSPQTHQLPHVNERRGATNGCNEGTLLWLVITKGAIIY